MEPTGAKVRWRAKLSRVFRLQASHLSLQYDHKLWENYTATFGKNDTIGFSIIPTSDRIGQIPGVYKYNGYPIVLDLHIYGTADKFFQLGLQCIHSCP